MSNTPNLDNIGDDDPEAVAVAPTAVTPETQTPSAANASATPPVDEKAAAQLKVQPPVKIPDPVLPVLDEDDAEQDAAVDVKLDPPKTLKDAYDLLQKAENMPEDTKAKRRLRTIHLAHARKWFGSMQQGAQPPTMTSVDLGNQFAVVTKAAVEHRIQELGRQYPEIATLIKERDELLELLKLSDAQTEK